MRLNSNRSDDTCVDSENLTDARKAPEINNSASKGLNSTVRLAEPAGSCMSLVAHKMGCGNRHLTISILTETFSRKMGYISCMLPKYLARLGHQVHVISMPFPPYYADRSYRESYGGFTSEEPLTPGLVEFFNDFTLHVLEVKREFGYMRMVGLEKTLAEIRPDIVQVNAAIGWIPMDAARLRRNLGYKLFTGNHNAMSTSRAGLGIGGSVLQRGAAFCTRFLTGRIASYSTERCYAVTSDCAEIAWRYYGVQKRKVETMHLGVDADFFFPVRSAETERERLALRKELGFAEKDIVCIYSGKMPEEKNARILGLAVNRLREKGYPYSGLFIGNGPQREQICAMAYCRTLDFMHFSKLAAYYRASEIGVWPTNESTSMLDAAACGIPIIISDGVVYREHVEGNGLVYHMNDLDDLVDKLLELRSPDVRARLGRRGAEKMQANFSWESVARRRLAHYSEAIEGHSVRSEAALRQPTRGD